MIKKFMCVVVIVSAIGAVTLFAQEGATKPAEGTLKLSKKSYTLTHAVAYKSPSGGEEMVAVVLSAQPISSEKLKRALAAEKEGGFGEFPQPFLELIFNKIGRVEALDRGRRRHDCWWQ